MRDQQTSAALGLPSRIHDEDCNVPRLMPSDLTETSVVPDTSTFGKQQEHHILYLIEMVELSKICTLNSISQACSSLTISALHYLDHLLAHSVNAGGPYAGPGAKTVDDVGVWPGSGVETGECENKRQALLGWDVAHGIQVYSSGNIGVC